MEITVQTHVDGEWRDAAVVSFNDPDRGISGPAVVSYETDYWADLASVDMLTAPVTDRRSVSVRYPVDVEFKDSPSWPAWLLDMMPQGPARVRIAHEEGFRPDDPAVEIRLLMRSGGAPIGNLRIREAYEAECNRLSDIKCPPLSDSDLETGSERFLDVINRFSLAASGSSGVQGEWPKALLTRSALDGFWYPDPFIPTGEGMEHVIVKLLKSSGDNDRLILAAEAPYLEIARAFGLQVGGPLKYHPGILIIPRFDRSVEEGVVRLHGQESLTSALGISAFGIPRTHEEYLEVIREFSDGPAADSLEYLMRDVLNLACGNPDNHGRNTALSRPAGGGVRLSPLFDFAPMRLSDAGIARQSRWACLGSDDPRGDWGKVCEVVACEGLSRDDISRALLKSLPFLRGLRGVATDLGVSDQLIERAIHPEPLIAAIERLEDGQCPK